MKKRVIIIAVIVLVLVLGLGLGIWYHKVNSLTEDEQFAVNIISDYKTRLKTPDSLKVFEFVFNSGDYALFDCSAKNSYGGDTRNVVCYSCKSGYLGDESSKEIGSVISKFWQMRNIPLDGCFTQINVEKVMKHVK